MPFFSALDGFGPSLCFLGDMQKSEFVERDAILNEERSNITAKLPTWILAADLIRNELKRKPRNDYEGESGLINTSTPLNGAPDI